jgi:DNA-directed RNA polymerase subunit M/transcription elongation factor TFIIS
MKCRKCGSEDVRVEFVQEQRMKEKKRKTFLYWVTVGWFVEPMLWFFLTMPKLIWELFKPRKYKMTTKTQKMAVCQSCGHSWKA